MANSIEDQFKKNWTDAERWVWEKIRSGQIADFNEKLGSKVDPRSANEWEQNRAERFLSAGFLETILSEEYFLSKVTLKGFRIAGACFKGDINLQHLKLERQLWMENCRFEGSVKLMNFYINDWFSLEGSWIGDALNLNGAQLNSYVSLKEITVIGKVNMISVVVGSNLEMDGGNFSGELDMASVKVGGSLYLRGNGNFNEVMLQNATIEEVAELEGSTFHKTLDMSLISVRGYLTLANKASFNEVYMVNAKIGGNLLLYGSTYNNFLELSSVRVDGSVFMDYKTTFKDVYLGNAKIESDLIMTESVFSGMLKMNSLRVGGSLYMNDGAEFNAVDLKSARIESMLSTIGSSFKGTLDMNSMKVNGSAFLRKNARFNDVNVANAEIAGNIELTQSTFLGELNMNSIKVSSSVFLKESNFREVNIASADIGANLEMSRSKCSGPVSINSANIGGSLFLDDASSFHKLNLGSIHVSNTVTLKGGTFNDELNMNSIKVDGSLFMDNGAVFKGDIDLISSRIGGNLEFVDSTFYENIILDNTDIGRNILAQRAKFAVNKYLKFRYSTIGSTLNFSGAKMGNLDMTSTNVKSELIFGTGINAPPKWEKSSQLILWNTTVGAIQDAGVHSWPENIELEGFTYHQLGGSGATGEANMAERTTKDFINWLERDKTFSPQSYEYLAKVLNEAGFPSKANSILHAGRKRFRILSWQKNHELMRWLGLTLLQSTIGFGLGARYFRVIYWLMAFSVIGFLVLFAASQNPNPDLFKMAWASFDATLPIIELNAHYPEYILDDSANWVKTWFYIQKMIGYILGGFIVAGLAGLTQKNS